MRNFYAPMFSARLFPTGYSPSHSDLVSMSKDCMRRDAFQREQSCQNEPTGDKGGIAFYAGLVAGAAVDQEEGGLARSQVRTPLRAA